MKRLLITFFSLAIQLQPAYAQNSLKSLEPAEYFDFWIGQWELSWEAADGSIEKGKNTIERILNDKVIKENFEAISGKMKGYIGKSYSVFNSKTGEWKQTWVDNSGAYLDFTGKFEGDKRMFVRTTKNENGEKVIQRMVFYEIKENSFQWDWEQSTDNGKNWDLRWKIAYRRYGK